MNALGTITTVTIALHFLAPTTHAQSGKTTGDDEGSPAQESTAPAKPKMPRLRFDNDAARATFTHAWLAFQDASWPTASKGFARALRGVTKADREEVQAFIDACKGAGKLDDIAVLVGKGRWRKAYSQIERLDKKYGHTPLEPFIAIQRSEIEERLFTVLADYEEEKDEGSKTQEDRLRELIETLGQGPKYSGKPEFVREGKRSLIYHPKKTRAGTGMAGSPLTFARLDPTLLREFRWLHVSILAPDPEAGALTLSFDPAEDPAVRTSTSQDASLDFHRFQPETKWTDLRIDLWSKRVRAIVAKQEVFGFRVKMQPIVEVAVYLDRVRLERP